MRFSTISSFIFASVAALVSAQGPSTQNAFTAPIAGDTLTAGQPFTLKWNNHVSDTVTLSLRSGNVNDLTQQTIIAQDIPNTGSYTWNVPSTIVYGSDDTIAIAWGAGGANQINFSARFILNSQFTSVASTTVSATSTSSDSSTGSSTAVSTTTASSATTSVSTSTSTGSNTTSTGTATTISSSAVKTSTSSSKISTSTGAQSSTGTKPATPAPTSPSSGTSNLASPLAIILCLMVAVMYTN